MIIVNTSTRLLDGDCFRSSGDENDRFKTHLDSIKKRFPSEKSIALIHCPTFSFDAFKPETAVNRGYYAYPPRGLQCLSASLKTIGVESRILDLNLILLEKSSRSRGAPLDLNTEMMHVLDDYFNENAGIRIVGVSSGVIVPNIFAGKDHPFLAVLRHLKEEDRFVVLAGGAVPTIEWRNLLSKNLCDFVFKGEAEERIKYFMSVWFDIGNIPSTAGICFPFGGELCESAGSAEMVDFQESLIHTYDSVDVDRYYRAGCLSPYSRMVGVDRKFGSIQLNRGCRMHCTFCGLSQYRGSNEVCQYPADVLMEEIRFLVKDKGVTHFEWCDEDFLANRDSLVGILNRIIEENLNITWAANIGIIAAFLDEEILSLMARSGCVGFRIGIETGNADMLKKIRKPATLPKLRTVSRLINQHPDMFVVGCYMIGFDGETYGQLFDTVHFAMEMRLSWAGIAVYQDIQETNLDPSDSCHEYEQVGSALNARAPESPDAGKNSSSIRDFIPSPEKVVGSTSNAFGAKEREFLSPKEIFQLPRDRLHSKDHVFDIWFTFNLLINYISNKNLSPGGNPDHFLKWVGALQLSYPDHALISLFLCLGHVVKGEHREAEIQHINALENLGKSDFWQERVKKCDLQPLFDLPPKNARQVYDALAGIKEGYLGCP